MADYFSTTATTVISLELLHVFHHLSFNHRINSIRTALVFSTVCFHMVIMCATFIQLEAFGNTAECIVPVYYNIYTNVMVKTMNVILL